MRDLIEYWQNKNITKEQFGDFHFIGHSLGAHGISYAAQMLKMEDNFEIDRLTGLDPAAPCFDYPEIHGEPPFRFSQDSASFVDVIHTDSSKIQGDGKFGIYDPLGKSC